MRIASWCSPIAAPAAPRRKPSVKRGEGWHAAPLAGGCRREPRDARPLRSAALLVSALGCLVAAGPASGQTLLERLEQRVRDRLAQTAPASAVPPAAGAEREGAGTLPPPPPPPAEPQRRAPVLGIEAEQSAGDRPALVVVRITPGSPAEAAGVRVGDELVAVGEQRVTGFADLNAAMSTLTAGERVTLNVRRGGLPMQTTALLAAAPPEADASAPPRPDRRPAGTEAGQSPPGAQLASPEVGALDPQAARPRPGVASAEEGGPPAGRLGVSVDDASLAPADAPVRRGALVVAVTPGSPAERAGIKAGDVIVALDGKLVSDVPGLKAELRGTRPGQQVELTYYQGAQMNRASVPLAGPGGVAAAARNPGERPAAAAESEAPSGGVGALLGGIGRFWGGGTDAKAVGTGAARQADAAAQSSAEVELRAEVERLRQQIEQLETRLAELEQQATAQP